MEAGDIDDCGRALPRLLASLAKLATARQAVAVAGEAVEGFAGAGQVEDSAVPQLLRDAQMLPVRDGTTDELALDALLRADLAAGLAALMGRASGCQRSLREPRLVAACRQAMAALERAALWLESGHDADVMQAGARRVAMTLARALELALLCEHAQWLLDHDGDRRGYAAALRFARTATDLMHEVDPELDRVLLAP
jgi:hypothetical protein